MLVYAEFTVQAFAYCPECDLPLEKYVENPKSNPYRFLGKCSKCSEIYVIGLEKFRLPRKLRIPVSPIPKNEHSKSRGVFYEY